MYQPKDWRIDAERLERVRVLDKPSPSVALSQGTFVKIPPIAPRLSALVKEPTKSAKRTETYEIVSGKPKERASIMLKNLIIIMMRHVVIVKN
jgi:hypothetical protein